MKKSNRRTKPIGSNVEITSELSGYRGRVVTTSMTLYPGDVEILDYLEKYLGANRSEVMRSALRAFAQTVTTVEQRRGL